MRLMNFFKKKAYSTVSGQNVKFSDLFSYMTEKGWYNVTSKIALDLYNKNSALADAVDLICTNAKSIQPVIKVTTNKEDDFIYDHPVLQLLEEPNKKDTYSSFIASIVNYYNLTGNALIQALGNEKFIPSELYLVPTDSISVSGQGLNSVIQSNNVSALQFLDNLFKYDPSSGRYIGEKPFTELLVINRFINYTTSNGYLADSILSSILYEIEMLNEGNSHSLNLFLNGVNLSGVFNIDTEDNKVIAQMREDIKNYFSGSSNTGKYIVTKGKQIQFTPYQMNNKDMQSIDIVKEVRKVIYDRFQIPQPLRNGDVQTYNNFSTAQLVLFEQTILPMINLIFENLTIFFRRRKALKPNEILTYDETQIGALQLKFNEAMKLKKELNIFTLNELRQNFGLVPYGEEADVIYQNNNLVPMGYSKEEQTENNDEQKRFKEVLKSVGYSQEEITKKVNELYADTYSRY